mmetsp:Transcript_45697/g.115019  ORF Transcript_45697/g.115019 Transcript_45697/m.115019 type:complete len:169 (-) Transcript_45697:73-579(-)
MQTTTFIAIGICAVVFVLTILWTALGLGLNLACLEWNSYNQCGDISNFLDKNDFESNNMESCRHASGFWVFVAVVYFLLAIAAVALLVLHILKKKALLLKVIPIAFCVAFVLLYVPLIIAWSVVCAEALDDTRLDWHFSSGYFCFYIGMFVTTLITLPLFALKGEQED